MKYGLISHAARQRIMYSERGRYVINIICDWLWEKGRIRANNDFSVYALLFEET